MTNEAFIELSYWLFYKRGDGLVQEGDNNSLSSIIKIYTYLNNSSLPREESIWNEDCIRIYRKIEKV